MDADCRDLLANERSEEKGGPGKEGAANLIWTNYFLLHHQQRKQEKLEQIGGKFEKASIPIPSMQCRRSNLLEQICFARKPPLITGKLLPLKIHGMGSRKMSKASLRVFCCSGFFVVAKCWLVWAAHAPANMTRGEPQCRPRLLSSCLFKRRRPDCVANYFKLVQSDPKYFKGHCIAAASEGQALGSFQITLDTPSLKQLILGPK